MDTAFKSGNRDRFQELAVKRLCKRPDCDRRMTVTARYTPHDATFIGRSKGPGLNLADLLDVTEPDYLERLCGRDVLRMRSFSDQVPFNHVGNDVTLVKYQPHAANPRKEVQS